MANSKLVKYGMDKGSFQSRFNLDLVCNVCKTTHNLGIGVVDVVEYLESAQAFLDYQREYPCVSEKDFSIAVRSFKKKKQYKEFKTHIGERRSFFSHFASCKRCSDTSSCCVFQVESFPTYNKRGGMKTCLNCDGENLCCANNFAGMEAQTGVFVDYASFISHALTFHLPGGWKLNVPGWVWRLVAYVSGVNPAYIVKLLEDIGLLIFCCLTSDNAVTFLQHISWFLKCRLESSVVKEIYDFLIQIFKEAFPPPRDDTVYHDFMPQGGEEENLGETTTKIEDKGEKEESNDFRDSSWFKGIGVCLEKLRGIFTDFESIKHSEIWKKFYEIFLYLMSFCTFKHLNIQVGELSIKLFDMSKWAAREGLHKGKEFSITMIDSLIFICERGYQAIKLGSAQVLLHSENTYLALFDKVKELRLRSTLLGNPEPHGFTRPQFFDELEQTVEKVKCILKNAFRLKPFEKEALRKASHELATIKAESVCIAEAMKARLAPLTFMVYGGTSVGKSSFMKYIIHQYAKTFGLPEDEQFMYRRNPEEKHWTNFHTMCWCLVRDDVAVMNPAYAPQGDKSLMELFLTDNNVPYSPEKSANEDKGKAPFRCELSVNSTNTQHLNAHLYFNCPAAVLRRFPYNIDIRVKPEFRTMDDRLDSKKVPQSSCGNFPNIWDIVVNKCLVTPSTLSDKRERAVAKYVPIIRFDDIDDFGCWLSYTAVEYKAIQEKVMNDFERLKETVICVPHCRNCQKKLVNCACEKKEFINGCYRPLDKCTCCSKCGTQCTCKQFCDQCKMTKEMCKCFLFPQSELSRCEECDEEYHQCRCVTPIFRKCYECKKIIDFCECNQLCDCGERIGYGCRCVDSWDESSSSSDDTQETCDECPNAEKEDDDIPTYCEKCKEHWFVCTCDDEDDESKHSEESENPVCEFCGAFPHDGECDIDAEDIFFAQTEEIIENREDFCDFCGGEPGACLCYGICDKCPIEKGRAWLLGECGCLEICESCLHQGYKCKCEKCIMCNKIIGVCECTNVPIDHEYRINTPMDLARARELYKHCCEELDAQGCYETEINGEKVKVQALEINFDNVNEEVREQAQQQYRDRFETIVSFKERISLWLLKFLMFPGIYSMMNLCFGSGWECRWYANPLKDWRLWRGLFSSAGRRARYQIEKGSRMSSVVYVLKLIAMAVAGYLVFQFASEMTTYLRDKNKERRRMRPQTGEHEEVGIEPERKEDGRPENYWASTDFKVTPFDLSPQITSIKSYSDDEFMRLIEPNIMGVKITKWGDAMTPKVSSRFNNMLCLFGQVYVINKHCLYHDDLFFHVITQVLPDPARFNANIQFRISRSDFKEIGENCDLVWAHIVDLPPRRDLTKLFPRKSFNGKFDGFSVCRRKDGRLLKTNQENIAMFANLPSCEWLGKKFWCGFTSGLQPVTAVGDCGMPLILKTNLGRVIAGIHCAGNPMGRTASLPLYQEMIEEIRENVPLQVQGGAPEFTSISVDRKFKPEIPEKSVFRFIEKGFGIVHGCVQVNVSRMKSAVRPTVIKDRIVERFSWKLEYGAPSFHRWKPWRNAVLGMIDPCNKFNTRILRLCAQAYLDDTIEEVGQEKFAKLHPVPLSTAINGADGVPYVDSINKSTSAGFPWNKSKKHFLVPLNPEDDLLGKVDVTPEIKERVDNMLRCADEGVRYCPITTGSLKDEARKLKKILEHNTRMFGAACLESILVWRMYYIMLFQLMYTERLKFEFAIGINVASIEWQNAYNYLAEYGTQRMICGDFGNFDRSQSARIIYLSGWICNMLCFMGSAFTGVDRKRMERFVYDVMFTVWCICGVIVTFFGVLPSGFAATVIFNCLCNCIYMRYVFFYLHPQHDENATDEEILSIIRQFKKTVRLLVYGDDNIMSVREGNEWFNHTDVARILDSVGIKYTMADKDAESKPYIDISECTFLKRAFVYNEDIGALVAPLELESIRKMLMIGVASNSLSEKAQTMERIESALREYVFYGKEIFQEMSTELRAICLECGMENYISKNSFRPFEIYKKMFWQNSQWTLKTLDYREPTNVSRDVLNKTRPELDELLATLRGKREAAWHQPTPTRADPEGTPSNDKLEHTIPQGKLEDYGDLEWVLNYRNNIQETIEDNISPYSCEWFAQTEEIPASSDVSTEVITRQQNVQFFDETQGMISGMAHASQGIPSNELTPDVGLKDFLSRPVRINSFTWNESDGIGSSTTINPWNLFFNDARIKYKLNNYSFIRCDLKLKIVINASPFYYGYMLGAYRPLQVFNAQSLLGSTSNLLVPYSQRPHVYLTPQHSEGAEMTLPFLWPRNWLRIQVASDFTEMGEFKFLTMGILQSANGATGTGVTVQTYAWAENVEISGPSAGLSMQGGCDEPFDYTGPEWQLYAQTDEYDGPVSGPASAIASVSRRLMDVPIIGRFATAATIGASAIAKISSLFGFSNTPVIKDVVPFRSNPFPHMASPEISYPNEKLTLDPKNELTVDPTALGLPKMCELDMQHLVQKESYLTQTSWTLAQAVDTILFSARINPSFYVTDSITNATVAYQTPMSWLAHMFQHWRGDIILRFKFVASPFHKGRVRISWDPQGYSGQNIVTDSGSTPVVQTAIVDLGKDTDIEFRIPFHQALPWLSINQSYAPGNINYSTSASPTWNANDFFYNGFLTVRVLTTLSAPLASGSSVPILVFVRGAENLEFANPSIYQGENYSNFAVQGGEDEQGMIKVGDTPTTIVAGSTYPSFPTRYLINMGEAVSSLYPVLRRHCLSYVTTLTNNAVHDNVLYTQTFSRMPLMYGYDPNGIHSAKGLVTPASNFNFNFVEMTYLNWVMPAFIAYRGSIIWTFNVESRKELGHVRAYRNPAISSLSNTVQTAASGTVSANARFYQTYANMGGSGAALTNQFTQSGLSIVCPMYNSYKFESTYSAKASAPDAVDGSNGGIHALEISADGINADNATNIRVWRYCAAGPDFSLHFFLNAPVLEVYSSNPTAN